MKLAIKEDNRVTLFLQEAPLIPGIQGDIQPESIELYWELSFEGIVALCATFKGRAPGRHGRQSVTSCWAEIHIRGVKLLPVSEIPPELLELIRDNMPLLPERDGRMTRATRVTHP